MQGDQRIEGFQYHQHQRALQDISSLFCRHFGFQQEGSHSSFGKSTADVGFPFREPLSDFGSIVDDPEVLALMDLKKRIPEYRFEPFQGKVRCSGQVAVQPSPTPRRVTQRPLRAKACPGPELPTCTGPRVRIWFYPSEGPHGIFVLRERAHPVRGKDRSPPERKRLSRTA